MTPPDNASDASTRRLFWWLQCSGWTASFLLVYIAALAHGKPATYWEVALSVSAAGFVLTLGLRELLRRFWSLPPRHLMLAMALPVLLVSALMGLVGMITVFRWCDPCRPSSPLAYGAYLINNLYVVMAWVSMYVGVKYYRQLQHQTRQALAADAMAHQSQLKMLRYQLNPHFLFNTLNAISTLILDRDAATANRMVQSLSAFLRHSLDNDPLQRVTLKQELDSLRLYLDIEKVRFADRLRVDLDIDAECYSALLPGLLLQPLIENAIKHAVARSIDGGRLAIHARRQGDMLELRIVDDGPGSPKFEPGARIEGNGVGLANARQRLLVLYGERQHFSARNRSEGGAEILMRLPFESGGAPRE